MCQIRNLTAWYRVQRLACLWFNLRRPTSSPWAVWNPCKIKKIKTLN